MIAAEEYRRRRRELLCMAGEGAAILLAAAPVRLRNADVAFPYRQDSDFLYLTGFPEPEAVLVLLPGRVHGEVVLFCRERDPDYERWHGPLVGTEGAVREYGMDDAFPLEDIDEILPGMLEERARVICHFGRDGGFDARLLGWMRRLRELRGGVVPKTFAALGPLINELRLYKSRAEMKLLREAARVTVAAHRAALRAVRPGRREYEVEAECLYALCRLGAVPAFPPIVAAGAHACVLHHHADATPLREGTLLLLDAGAEVGGYACDLSRSYPVGGRYAGAQRALYEVVLAAQHAALAEVRPGRPFDAAYHAARRVLAEGLCALGLWRGGAEAALAGDALRRFVPGKTGHWLGLDVHDVGDYQLGGLSRLLEPGMVLTVEPGVYVPVEDTTVDACWRGIGIRIEDTVAVTADGHEVLTAALPKAPTEVEALLASS
ncbi:MAG: aminopeptidase P N-terminal domain-containing protein [Fulvimonas sp.]|nr:aminopeptidase P N-terminal domain-containing protein [Fulvimonas sp.]